jgi:hypothetical protein
MIVAPLCIAACGEPAEEEVRFSSHAIIYGDDTRTELGNHANPRLRLLSERSVLALLEPIYLQEDAESKITIVAPTVQEAFSICSDEPFALQPSAAVCTGVLIDSDLLVTASHCVGVFSKPCERQVWAFGYHLDSEDGQVGRGDIYRCRKIADSGHGPASGDRYLDYAFVQLDRVVEDNREVVNIAKEAPAVGDPLLVVGTPLGVPAKLDDGARVIESRLETMDYFKLDADAYQGSSGSGIFNQDLSLVGVLVRGQEDLTWDQTRACHVSRRIDAGSTELSERGGYVTSAVSSLCEGGWQSKRLCAREGDCGDGHCGVEETAETCGVDCPVLAPLTLGPPQRPIERPDSGCSVGSASHDRALATVAGGISLLAFGARFRARRRTLRSDKKFA